jgi:hypothetical protein
MQRHDDTAEHIITTAGLAFSLATKFGKDTDLREARGHLKDAIVRALENELRLGVEAGKQRTAQSAE